MRVLSYTLPSIAMFARASCVVAGFKGNKGNCGEAIPRVMYTT